jgi:ADP-dependent phosphofructokinase/glucokinase
MAKVEYAFPVDKVHGKISKKHRVGFAHRKATARNYTTSYGERSTPVTSNEMAVRTKFTAVCAAARARLGNITKSRWTRLLSVSKLSTRLCGATSSAKSGTRTWRQRSNLLPRTIISHG